MHLLLLGGNSSSHKDWIIKIEKALKEYFDTSHVHSYKHWETGEDLIKIENEVEDLLSHIKDVDDKEYIIFAKSIGAVLAVKAISDNRLAPIKCIFAGFPVNFARENGFDIDSWMKNYKTPTLFFQKSEDPMFSYNELLAWLTLEGVENYKTIQFPGKDHHYEDIDSIKTEVANFIYS